jgi:hypothetical protein
MSLIITKNYCFQKKLLPQPITNYKLQKIAVSSTQDFTEEVACSKKCTIKLPPTTPQEKFEAAIAHTISANNSSKQKHYCVDATKRRISARGFLLTTVKQDMSFNNHASRLKLD